MFQKGFEVGEANLTQVVGFQICGGNIAGSATAPINDQGSFSLNIAKGGPGCGVLAMLIDPSGERKIDQVKGFLSIPDDSGGELIGLPTASSQSMIDLGNLGDTGASQKTMDELTSVLGVTTDRLKEIAKLDAVLTNIKNSWANESNGIYYRYTPGFEWGGNYAAVQDGWTDVTQYFFKGSQFFFRTNDPAITAASICPSSESERTPLALLPPGGFEASVKDMYNASSKGELINAATGFNNNFANPSGSGCTSQPNETHPISGTFHLSQESGAVNFNWGGGGIAGDFPEGIWTLKLGNAEKAWFDIKSVSPLNSSGNPLVYVPQFKIEKDGNNKITEVSVKFCLWNGSACAGVTDPAVLNDYAKFMSLALTDIPMNQSNPNINDELTLVYQGNGVYKVVPTKDFCYGGATSCQYTLDSLSLSYSLFGVGVRFDLRYLEPV